ncbi:Hypothetical protein SRAE_2000057100 [Strongyloides ratti]|uniref:Uncharacterized protein n=1 Tax=Strongyloides ratti TaxID=34506 RepID=A0A090L7W5_STRRB|nr:Hypothetical protein SRAE_2000057100 [Strongyloides ratti]CEF65896.1 Hypothetical protein SRAE_2000057100 [Strongyloides ratti]
MLSPIYYCDKIYSPYSNSDIEIISPENYNIHVAELKAKFEDITNLTENKKSLITKKRLNKISVQKLLKSRGFIKGNEITYGALVLPDYNKSDNCIERDNNRYYEKKEIIWTPIRHQPNIKVSNLMKNLEDLEKQGCLKTPSRFLKKAFENFRFETISSPVTSNNNLSSNMEIEKDLKKKKLFKKSKETLIPIFNKRISPQGFNFTKSSLEKLHKMNNKKIKESGDTIKTKGFCKKLTQIIEYKKLTKKSKIPIISKETHSSNYGSTIIKI